MNPETSAEQPQRDLWRDMAWGVSRGLALACLPLLLTVLPGRMPVSPDRPRLVGGSDSAGAILALGAALGLVAGLLRPLGRSFLGSLLLGCLLADGGLFLLRVFGPKRPDTPPFDPFGPGLLFGVMIGLALYLSELHKRTERNSLTG